MTSPTDPTAVNSTESYPSLAALREAHGALLDRRRTQGETPELVERLRTQRLLAVVGPSGSGKSSLVLAGLIPALKAGALPGSQDWCYLPPLVPGSDPLANLLRRTLDVEVSPPHPDAATLLHD